MPFTPLSYGLELGNPPRMLSLSDSITEWGYDKADFEGAITLLDLIADEDGPFMAAVARQVFAGEHSSCTVLYHLRTKEQGPRWVLDRIHLALGQSGRPCCYGCALDVNDLVENGAWPFSEPTAWLEDGGILSISTLLREEL